MSVYVCMRFRKLCACESVCFYRNQYIYWVIFFCLRYNCYITSVNESHNRNSMFLCIDQLPVLGLILGAIMCCSELSALAHCGTRVSQHTQLDGLSGTFLDHNCHECLLAHCGSPSQTTPTNRRSFRGKINSQKNIVKASF